MKKCFIPLFTLMLMTGPDCKREKQPNSDSGKKWVVTTIAGEGTGAFEDGAALSAKFSHPFDIVVGNDGAVYVTDLDNRRIRKINNGQVSTFAGNGNRGILNADGPSAQFISPFHLAFDPNGSLYTSDAEDARIRRISMAARVSSYAGTSSLGFKDGKIDSAQLDYDDDMVSDTQGNIFIADPWNNRIRKINRSGDVSTIAGSDAYGFKDGKGDTAQFRFPGAIALDKQGNLYVADISNYRIRKITPDGYVSTFAGSGMRGFADGDTSKAQFYDLYDIAIDNQGNLYVADNHRIRQVSPQGIVSTLIGSTTFGYEDGDSASAKFYYPHGIAVDAHNNIYVADTYNHRIREIIFK